MTKKEYEALSDRTQGTFANRRGAIYAIFDQYRKLKAERNEKDAADRSVELLSPRRSPPPLDADLALYVRHRTHAILDGMDTFPDRIPKIDFINVDEVCLLHPRLVDQARIARTQSLTVALAHRLRRKTTSSSIAS